MEKNVNVGSDCEWLVLFKADGEPFYCGEKVVDTNEDGMITVEGYGLYPERLTLRCDSALSAQEILEAMFKAEDRHTCECV